jgi:DNA-binding transcriptional LysR family regulator
MEQYKSGDAGQLVIGVTPFRSSYLIPEVTKAFRTAYPNIQVKLQEAGSDILRKEAAEGKYDFAVVNLPVDESLVDVIPLEADRLALVVPQEWMHLLPLEPDCKEIDFSICKELPFAVVQKTQEMRKLFDKLCAANNFQPNIAAEVVSLTTAWAMACAGVAATILPLQFVNHRSHESNLTIVGIKNAAHTRQPVIITRRGQYIAPHARYAIELLTEGK